MDNNINLNLYIYFYSVAKNGTLAAASEELFVSSPAISKNIKKLESILNRKLFFRNRNGMELTSYGRELYKYVSESFETLSLAHRNMLEEESLKKGSILVGMPSNIGSFYIFDNLMKFRNTYPGIEITVITGGTSKLIGLLKNHKVDFVIDTSPINEVLDENTVVKELDEVKYTFIANKSSEYKTIKSIKDLDGMELILPIKGTANRIDIDKTFKKYNLNNIKSINLHTSEMIISAVKNNLGIGYVIENLIEKESDIVKLNLKEELPTVKINLIYNKDYLTYAPKKFINTYIDNNINF